MNKSRRIRLVNLLIAVLLVFLLFFIDEGHYDFRWMKNSNNWIYFLISTAFIFCGQSIAMWMVRRSKGTKKLLLSNLIGLPLGLLMIAGVFRLIVLFV